MSIKSVPSIAGSSLTDNKNERMDFATSDGNIRLYFNLLNYSEFVSETNDFMVSEGLIDAVSSETANSISEEIETDYGIDSGETSRFLPGITTNFLSLFRGFFGLIGRVTEPIEPENNLTVLLFCNWLIK